MSRRGRELSVGDVARLTGKHPSTIYRWFRDELEPKYGVTVIGRRGRKMFTTVEALARVSPIDASAVGLEGMVRKLEKRITETEERQAEAEQRLDKEIEERRREFQRISASFFKKIVRDRA